MVTSSQRTCNSNPLIQKNWHGDIRSVYLLLKSLISILHDHCLQRCAIHRTSCLWLVPVSPWLCHSYLGCTWHRKYHKNCDTKADLWSVGAVFYKMAVVNHHSGRTREPHQVVWPRFFSSQDCCFQQRRTRSTICARGCQANHSLTSQTVASCSSIAMRPQKVDFRRVWNPSLQCKDLQMVKFTLTPAHGLEGHQRRNTTRSSEVLVLKAMISPGRINFRRPFEAQNIHKRCHNLCG